LVSQRWSFVVTLRARDLVLKFENVSLGNDRNPVIQELDYEV
jgi:hypothetical protein